jgi:hypothetical protein
LTERSTTIELTVLAFGALLARATGELSLVALSFILDCSN